MQGIDRTAVVRIDDVDPNDMAGHWLASSDLEISVDSVDGGLVLRSASMTASQMEDAWLCASMNERLLAANVEVRRLVLADLFA